MVTKSIRMHSRRTITPGKVPAPSEVLEAEICINLADRQTYTKDHNGNIFKIAGGGRKVGDFLQLEDTDGVGLPTIRTDDRIIFTKSTATADDPYQFGFIRKTGAIGGSGVVNANVAAYLEVEQTTPNFQWNMLTSTTVKAASVGGGEHVNFYAQAIKRGDSSLWGMCLEYRDHTINPGSGSVGMEFGFFVNGADNNKLRHGLDFSFGGVTNELGDNVISTGIRMGPSFGQPGRMILRKAQEISGRVDLGIDLSGIMNTYSDRMMAFNTNGKIIWRDGMATADRASFGWNGTVQTFTFSGAPISLGAAGTPDRKVKFNFDGQNYYLNLTLAP